MKKITLFTAITCCIVYTHAQTNVWDGSTTSTITTGGKVAIGTATPDPNTALTIKNTLNTLPNGIYNEITNNSTASEQYGIQNKITFNGTGAGYRAGFSQIFQSNSPTDNYGMLLSNTASNLGNRFGLVSLMFNGTKTECGIYSAINPPGFGFPVLPAGDRSGYFLGAFEVVARANTEKVFMISQRTNFSVSGTGTDVFRIYGDGRVFATEINVKLATSFPDYVFSPGYQLMPLREVGHFIRLNGHLPNVPTAETVEKEGMNVGEMNRVLVEKIEELTLYLLQQQAEIDSLKQEMIILKQQ